MPGLPLGMMGKAGVWAAGLYGMGQAAIRSPIARGAAIGGLAGGVMGSMGDTGFWRGAAVGAGAGAYGGRLWSNPRVAMGMIGGFTGMGAKSFAFGAKAAGQQMMADARSAGRFIGRTARRAYNSFPGFR